MDGTGNVEAYPERGIKAYSVILGAWLALFPASGLLNSTGIFQAYLLNHDLKGYAESEVGWIFSTFCFLFFFGGLQAGPIFDKYGLRLLLPAGAVGIIASMILTSFCKTYSQFMMAFGILGGFSSSIIWTCSIATVGHWFQQNRALATGLATTAGGFGGVFYPLLFNLLSGRFGLPWALRCFALVAAVCLSLSYILLKTRLPRNEHARLLLDWRGFNDARFTVTMLAIFILDWAVLVPPSYITTYASSHGFTAMSPYVLAILNSVSILGRAIPGSVADKVGRFNVMVICSGICSICIFGLWLSASYSVATMVAFAVLYGFFSGPAYSLTPVCVAQLCRTEEYASRYGTAYGLASLGTLAGIPISGNILETGKGDNYQALILFCGAAYMCAAGLFALARVLSRGWKLRIKF